MRIRKISAVAAMLSMLPATSFAGGVCVNDSDATALKTAGLQQELMVAALTCDDIALYNRFVISYRTQLRQSDNLLISYFRRWGSGDADYHAYKTRLANQSSLDRLHDPAYCAKAKTAFDDALDSGKSDLAQIVAGRDLPGGEGMAVCGQSAQSGPYTETANTGSWRQK